MGRDVDRMRWLRDGCKARGCFIECRWAGLNGAVAYMILSPQAERALREHVPDLLAEAHRKFLDDVYPLVSR